jgi:NADH-quinone oxidoreductase subunit J
MKAAFIIAAAVALAATALAISRARAIHALLFLIASLLALSVVFATVGAPLAAGLEIVVYAGAIMVLFLFAIMLLNVQQAEEVDANGRLRVGTWIVGGVAAVLLVVELAFAVLSVPGREPVKADLGPVAVGKAVFGPYMIAVELASFLLLVGLIGAFHLGRTDQPGSRGRRR